MAHASYNTGVLQTRPAPRPPHRRARNNRRHFYHLEYMYLEVRKFLRKFLPRGRNSEDYYLEVLVVGIILQ